jgi:transposase
MTLESRAASMSQEELVALLASHQELQRSHDDLARQVEWFKRQLFGTKSERRLVDAEGLQLTLGGLLRAEAAAVPEIEIAGHRRRRTTTEGIAEHDSLRFDPSVPVEEIQVPDPGLRDQDLANYDLIGEKVTCRLAQRPGSYVVLRYVRKVYKRKSDGVFSCPPSPPSVLERSYADVSFLAGLLIDKFRSYLPLYRQHQRLDAAGVHLGRSTLTTFAHRTIDLLEPIYAAQVESILSGRVLAMDETPIKAGRAQRPPPERGRMKLAYFWPIYGDKDEIAFPFATTRAGSVVREVLKAYVGVLLTDGYEAYNRHAQAVNGIVHATCWSHTRRQYVEAEFSEPALAREAEEKIGRLYAIEATMKTKMLSAEEMLTYRAIHARPVVDEIFVWLRATLDRETLLPSSLFAKAARYTLSREKELRVFLEYPDVPIDTNHLEREIRPIALGRKNWNFCSTELGAKYVGIIQSLLATCRVQGVDPYTYLVDVLQRIETHPAKDVALLTPRLWKEHFGGNPLRSDLDRNS